MKSLAVQVVDLAFGDSGKGTLVDYLVRRTESNLVVRFNGGPQAGHNVVLPDGRHHTFAQFGSGTFVPGVRTLLSRYMLIEPYAMLNEAAHLDSIGVPDALRRTFIDERCLVITPVQQIVNHLRERARGAGAHGTCGMGVGECVADSIASSGQTLRAGDLRDQGLTRRRLRAALEQKMSSFESWRSIATPGEIQTLTDPSWIEVAIDTCAEVMRQVTILSTEKTNQLLRDTRHCVFEGAQGVLLDERFGFHPHTTWSTTTFANADALLDEARSDADRQRIGVMRTYMTRHGAGPFVTEKADLRPMLPEAHNTDQGRQGVFRRGVLDLVMLRYALAACGGVDALAITHVDRLPQLPQLVCDRYQCGGKTVSPPPHAGAAEQSAALSPDTLQRAVPRYRRISTQREADFIAEIESASGARIRLRSRGPTFSDKQSIE